MPGRWNEENVFEIKYWHYYYERTPFAYNAQRLDFSQSLTLQLPSSSGISRSTNLMIIIIIESRYYIYTHNNDSVWRERTQLIQLIFNHLMKLRTSRDTTRYIYCRFISASFRTIYAFGPTIFIFPCCFGIERKINCKIISIFFFSINNIDNNNILSWKLPILDAFSSSTSCTIHGMVCIHSVICVCLKSQRSANETKSLKLKKKKKKKK